MPRDTKQVVTHLNLSQEVFVQKDLSYWSQQSGRLMGKQVVLQITLVVQGFADLKVAN